MADEQQVKSAEPSTATEPQINPYASGKLTPEIEKSFREGKEAAPVKQKSGSAESSASETKSEPTGKSASESEAGKSKQERGKGSAEERISQLTAKEKAAIERAEKAERALNELRTAQSKPAQAQQVAGDDPEPQEPKWEDFKDKPYTDYEAALRKHNRELAMWAGRQEYKKHQAEQANTERIKSLNAQVEEARKAYPDWDEKGKPALKAVFGDGVKDSEATKAAAHPAIQAALGRSPVLSHLLYVLGKENISDFVQLSKSDPIAALRELHLKEFLLIPELEKARKEAEALAAQNAGKETPAKTATPEPKPHAKPNNEVGSRGTGPNDVAADAVRRNDFRSFDREQMRKAAQRRGVN